MKNETTPQSPAAPARIVDMCEGCKEAEADVIDGPVCLCQSCFDHDHLAQAALMKIGEREAFMFGYDDDAQAVS